jgi:hypothetical protein
MRDEDRVREGAHPMPPNHGYSYPGPSSSFFLFMRLSHVTYGDHGDVHHCPQSIRCKLPFAPPRPGPRRYRAHQGNDKGNNKGNHKGKPPPNFLLLCRRGHEGGSREEERSLLLVLSTEPLSLLPPLLFNLPPPGAPTLTPRPAPWRRGSPAPAGCTSRPEL